MCKVISQMKGDTVSLIEFITVLQREKSVGFQSRALITSLQLNLVFGEEMPIPMGD